MVSRRGEAGARYWFTRFFGCGLRMTIREPKMNEDFLSIASDIVEKARGLGADEADVVLFSSTESSVQVRRGQVERVIDAGSHAAGIRVIKGKRTAICSTADL